MATDILVTVFGNKPLPEIMPTPYQSDPKEYSLRYWGRNKMAATYQTTFSNAFSWMKCLVSVKISLKFVPKGPINNIPSLVQMMAWRRPCDKLLSEPMVVSLVTHTCVSRPQRVNNVWIKYQTILSWDLYIWWLSEHQHRLFLVFARSIYKMQYSLKPWLSLGKLNMA